MANSSSTQNVLNQIRLVCNVKSLSHSMCHCHTLSQIQPYKSHNMSHYLDKSHNLFYCIVFSMHYLLHYIYEIKFCRISMQYHFNCMLYNSVLCMRKESNKYLFPPLLTHIQADRLNMLLYPLKHTKSSFIHRIFEDMRVFLNCQFYIQAYIRSIAQKDEWHNSLY